jgi:hypothetical protein
MSARSRDPLLQTHVKQAVMSVVEIEEIFMVRFYLSPSDGSSRATLTVVSTTVLGSVTVPEEAPAPAPVESMSRTEPGTVTSFDLECPLTMEVMRDPVMIVDGQTYERVEIEKWIALGNRTSPLTGEELPRTNLFPNIVLCTVIRECGLLRSGIGMMGHRDGQEVLDLVGCLKRILLVP